MTDILLDVDVVVEIGTTRVPDTAAASTAFDRAARCGHRIWLSVAGMPTLVSAMAEALRRILVNQGEDPAPQRLQTLVRERLAEITSRTHWLAALAEDGALFDQPDPGAAQRMRAVMRLGSHARLLTRDPAVLAHCPQAMTPEQFLEQPECTRAVALIDLAAQQDRIRPQLERHIHAVLHHGCYIMGPEVRAFETALADWIGVKHAIGCSSCTDALLMGLMAHGVGPGDAVFTTAFTFIATVEVAAVLGATPVFVDIDPRTFNLDPVKLEEAIQAVKKAGRLTPRGVVPVDLYGLPADYDAIEGIAAAHGLFVLEDAAQGLGGRYKTRKAGSFGQAAAVSFFPAKPLGCYGDGGALLTNDDALAELFNSLRFHGKGSEKYDNVRIGVNARLDTLQAAILLPKLALFSEELSARQRVADYYGQGLQDLVEIPYVPPAFTSAWAQYTVLSDRRDVIQAALKKHGFPSAVYYPRPLHLQTAFRDLAYQVGDFPLSERAAQRVLGLPMHPYLKTEDMDRIIEIVRDGLRG